MYKLLFFVGHLVPGLFFCMLGLWHMFNHTKLHALNPNSYANLFWFPTSKIKYLELYLIMLFFTIFIYVEIFVATHVHHPLDTDFTIPSYHLPNFEHSVMSLSMITYAFFAIVLDKVGPPARRGLTHILGAMAFAHELFIFHVHSTDHIGIEGQYHWLLQIVLFLLLATTLLSLKYSRSFLLGFTRSLAIVSQGVWLILIGCVYIPGLTPKGCLLSFEHYRQVVHCQGEMALHRAKSLANITFSFYMVWMSIFGVAFYLAVVKLYGTEAVVYQNVKQQEEGDDDFHDIESPGRKWSETNC